MSALLDTNVLIDHLRNREPAVDFITKLPRKPAASVVTLCELMAGARSRKEEEAIASLACWIRFLNVDTAIARRAGEHIRQYGQSHGIDDLDALIAATADHHGLALATLNVKHFPMFPRLKPAY